MEGDDPKSREELSPPKPIECEGRLRGQTGGGGSLLLSTKESVYTTLRKCYGLPTHHCYCH